jgi:S-adenosylmethionine:tRNA ribosyltransferase-isomerase
VKTADFDYELPPDRIAQQPLPERDAARMLVLNPLTGQLIHTAVRELPTFLNPGDLLVLNDSRVLPARLIGIRDDGGEAEVLLLRAVDADSGRWEALTRPGRRLRAGAQVRFAGSSLTVGIEEPRADSAMVRLGGVPDVMAEVRRIGRMPTPPYVKQQLADPERYQTIYAREEGSAAAPTAGLHFTPALLAAIRARGVEVVYVTLHVGLDTFRPVRDDDPSRHPMHKEWYRIEEATAAAVTATRERKGRAVAVGTTCVRVLESAARESVVQPGDAWTGLLILPGHRFRVVDAMLTNFHLPKSTLLMLVSAFAGKERIFRAYREAIEQGYRFYSFGDCMFITGRAPLPDPPPAGGGRELA